MYANAATAPARPLLPAQAASGLPEMAAMLQGVRSMHNAYVHRTLLQSVVLLMLMLRLISLIRCQVRLSLFPRTLLAAAYDIGLFVGVYVIIFVLLGVALCTIFGPVFGSLASLDRALTCLFGLVVWNDRAWTDSINAARKVSQTAGHASLQHKARRLIMCPSTRVDKWSKACCRPCPSILHCLCFLVSSHAACRCTRPGC